MNLKKCTNLETGLIQAMKMGEAVDDIVLVMNIGLQM